MPVKSHKELVVWQKSMELVVLTYRATADFPKEEQYGLVSQIRRAAVSIPSNIAEGQYRGTRKDYVQFLRIAYGSAAELETQLEIARRLSFGVASDRDALEACLQEVMRMLGTIIGKLKT